MAPPDMNAGRPDLEATKAKIEKSAEVHQSVRVGAGTIVWGLAQVRENAEIGRNCVISRGAYVGAGVRVGDRVKIQNHALVYEPAVLEDGAFVGPAAVLTNDVYPRSITPDGALKRGGDWEAVGVVVRHGASVGARAVCVAPITIGRWAMVAAGAVVTRDVPDHAIVAGVPARWLGWVGRAGVPLLEREGHWVCPQTGEQYEESGGTIRGVGHESLDDVADRTSADR